MTHSAQARLVLSALAASYVAYLLAVAGQFALPGLVLGSRSGAEIEWVRVSPLAVQVRWSGELGRVALAFTRTWEIAGGILALLAARFAGPVLRLALLQTAAWWFLLRLLLAVVNLLFAWRWQALLWPALPALAGLMLPVWELARFAQPYVSATRGRRAAGVAVTFCLPAAVAIITFGRWTRSPMLIVLPMAAGVIAFSLLASALARATQERRDWSASAAWRSVAAALLLASGLALYPAAHRAAQDRALGRFSSAHYEILYANPAYEPAELKRIGADREQALEAAAQRLGVNTGGLRLRVFLYPTYEAKQERSGSTAPWTADAREIHVVVNDQRPSPDPVADATALVLARWDEPGMPFLREAAAVFAAGVWRGHTPRDWAAQITAEEGVYSLAQLSDESAFLSPLVRRPLAGEFGAWAGRERLRALYRATPGGPDWRVPLEEGWRRHLRELAAGWKWDRHSCLSVPNPGDSAQAGKPVRASYFHKGVALSHEGGARGGYGSRRAARVLESFPAMGVNAVSLQPYAFLPRPAQPVLRLFTDESDEALDHATFIARRAGLRVTLKPQIWLSWGRWSGDIAFTIPADWESWWAQYRQWILHYARLAELNGTGLFVVGTELGGTTALERGQQQAWRRIIGDVRRVYHGPLTYAAHWGPEFENLPFWDALDFLGLNFYYPLASDADGRVPSWQAAERVAQAIEQAHRRWNKPVLFTEIGFPSASGAAREPWRENPSDTPDPAQQALCYQVVFRTFYHRPWLAGLYWWKWYSSGRGGGEADRLYTPMNKPAAGVIAQWYRNPNGGR